MYFPQLGCSSKLQLKWEKIYLIGIFCVLYFSLLRELNIGIPVD
jgi:hypothetical protein